MSLCFHPFIQLNKSIGRIAFLVATQHMSRAVIGYRFPPETCSYLSSDGAAICHRYCLFVSVYPAGRHPTIGGIKRALERDRLLCHLAAAEDTSPSHLSNQAVRLVPSKLSGDVHYSIKTF